MTTFALLAVAGTLTILSLQVPALLLPAAVLLGIGLHAAYVHARQ